MNPHRIPATFPRALLLLAVFACFGTARARAAVTAAMDSGYTPSPSFRVPYPFFDSTGHEPRITATIPLESESEAEWLRAPMGDHLLDHPEPWSAHHRSEERRVGKECRL